MVRKFYTSNRNYLFFVCLLTGFLFTNLAHAQVSGSNTNTVADDGSDAQSVSTTITMGAGSLNSASDLTIAMSAGHTWVGDVTATLATPCGTTTLFARPNAGSGDNGDDLTTGGDYIFTSTSATNFPVSSGGLVIHDTYLTSFSGLSLPCSDISGDWTLTLTTNSGDHGRVLTLYDWSISVEQECSPTQATGSNNNTVADDGSDAQSISTTISMGAGSMTSVEDISISLSASHTWVGDVTATLATPCGTMTLFSRPATGSGDNGNDLVTGGDYIFTSTSATTFPVSSGGLVNHDTYLASFSGLSFPCSDISGDWTLTLSTNSGDHGRVLTLYNWSISIEQTCGSAEITYFDSDGDGIIDNIDIDDDNDGILDVDECDSIVNPPLQNPDFEAIDILSLDGGPTDVVPTAGIWKGDASHIPDWLSADTTNNYLEIWHNSQAAGNDAGGQAYSGTHWAEVNATTNDGLYQDIVSTPGDVLQWSFAHRKRTGYAGSATEDIVRLLIGDPGGTMSSQGDFTSAGDSSWTLHSGLYTVPAGQTTTRLTFTVLSTASGSTSSGNFIDNVELYVAPSDCLDTDGDTIPDYFDLDSDNDGIPDIVETGLGYLSNGTGVIPLNSFVDSNNNGMHDSVENNTPLDSDGDGIPNFKDLDSDNDTIFDVDESGTGNSNNSAFQNGDGDINGDGVGDGIESEVFREKDDDNDSTLEYFGDGILDIYDYGTGANEYGNLSQGTGPLFVKDTDGDGIPDYIDIMSDGSTFDISNTLYAPLDANNDGLIDDTIDSDDDGIVDLFDTNDSVFGSPRDLDLKLQLYFDGRNDYVEDFNVINGWGEATLMTWIKIDPSASGDQIILGQDSFYIKLKTNLEIEAKANNKTVSNGSALTTNQWIHVASTYSDTNGELILYINGQNVASYDVSGALPSDSSSLTLGREPNTNNNYFHGYIDEVRVFSQAITENELQKMVHQEIDDNNGIVRGTVIPLDITNFVDKANNTPLSWSNLTRYYRMDTFKDDILDDLTTPEIDEGSGAKIYNHKVINEQSAPLPFVTKQSGLLNVAVNDSTNGINGGDAVNPSAIVKIIHDDVYIDSNSYQTGLIIEEQDSESNPIEFTVQNDSELNVSWYLKLDGKIDLESESQLIQGLDSNLSVGTNGKLERDQQGTADTYTYNYWSSPVGATDIASNNYQYTVQDVMFDGVNPVNFSSSGYNGANTNPVKIADYWIWKYANNPSGTYSGWQHVRRTGTLYAGEGFTMKGPGSGPISDDQNYVFLGKPNNGDVNLSINSGNDYLVGNPYPSAIDAVQFILDNGPTIDGGTGGGEDPLISGTLYFWEHWGGGSHYLSSYQGGYATYTLAGGTPAAAYGQNDPDVGTGGTPAKIPGRYIPVSQGFFVTAESNGQINFNNGQRIYRKEDATSVFVRSAENNIYAQEELEDSRPKVRIGFNSVNTLRRQLLLTIDPSTSQDYDWGYDALLNEGQMDDMYWIIDNDKYIIQSSDYMDTGAAYPLGLKTVSDGFNTITLDHTFNVDNNIKIYLHDTVLDTYTNLLNEDFDIFLNAGEYNGRFEIIFARTGNINLLDTEENEDQNVDVLYSNDLGKIVITNPKEIQINSIELYNILGQTIQTITNISEDIYSEYDVNNLSTGTYIIKLNTVSGSVSKKVIAK